MARTKDIAGQTVFITGPARGIGAETARQLHARGANVALAGLEPERLEQLAAELGERVLWHEADATDFDALSDAVAATTERFGGIDASIANAGVHYVGAFETAPLETLERELEINLMGVLRTNRAVLPALIESKGYMLSIASLAAASHAPMMAPYSASKAGVEALSNSLRIELAGKGVAVGCAYFGLIGTDMVTESLAEPSTQAAMPLMPGFARKITPVSRAAGTLIDGIENRKARVWAPRYVGPALLSRGWLQPVMELRAMRSGAIRRAVELAETAIEVPKVPK